MNKQKNGPIGFLLAALPVAVAAALPISANATQWTWDSGSAAAVAGYANKYTITATGDDGKTKATVTVTGYYANGVSGNLAAASSVTAYTGGFGINNGVSTDTGEGTSPEHAVDNDGRYDILVFEMPNDTFDLKGFQLGWTQEGNPASSTTTADMTVLYGGSSPITFTGETLTSLQSLLTNQSKTLEYASSGTNLANSLNNNVPIDNLITDQGTTTGRYLVVAGALSGTGNDGTSDFFKVDVLKGSGKVPVPGTAALLGLVMGGLLWTRRSKARC